MRRAIDRPTYHSQRVSRIEHARCINKQRSDGWIFVTRRVKRNNNISRLLPVRRFAFFRFASTKGLDRASLLNIIQVDITYKVISRFFAIGRRKKIDLRVFFFFLSRLTRMSPRKKKKRRRKNKFYTKKLYVEAFGRSKGDVKKTSTFSRCSLTVSSFHRAVSRRRT